MPNIAFQYLYRDSANYKNHGTVIFSNPESISLDQIQASIKAHLIDGEYFDHEFFHLPSLFFPNHNIELDHDWHEYDGVQTTSDSTNQSLTIFEFISRLKRSSH